MSTNENISSPTPDQNRANDDTVLPPLGEAAILQEDGDTSVPTTGQSTTTNTESPKEDMEVHHHSHSPRKQWTHYFWEFFMLFLAVTLGFFVENQREHYIENNRAKQYATLLYNDLIKDTINLHERTAFMSEGVAKLDTLIALLKTFKTDDSATATIYALSAYAYTGPFFTATTSTMEQLKNSGSLRYFQSKELSRHFSSFDSDLQRLKSVEERNVYLNEETRKFLAGFLDLKNISRLTVGSSDDAPGFRYTSPSLTQRPALYHANKNELQHYANLCVLKQLDWTTRINLQTRLLNSMRALILSLKEEYDPAIN